MRGVRCFRAVECCHDDIHPHAERAFHQHEVVWSNLGANERSRLLFRPRQLVRLVEWSGEVGDALRLHSHRQRRLIGVARILAHQYGALDPALRHEMGVAARSWANQHDWSLLAPAVLAAVQENVKS